MKDLVLAFKITADSKELKAESAASSVELDKLGATATETASALNATSAAADRLASESKQAAVGAQALAQSSAQVTAAATAEAAAHQRRTQEAARYGMTLGQYQQAQRQLPMQITDVVTSLSSGMPVYMVAIQQGGQLRDSYGGVGNAARALSGIIKPMYLGIGAGVGVVAALGMAYLQTYQEMQGYERALISTGNVTSATAGELAELTDQVGAATGEFESAQAAVLQLAESGKFTSSQLNDASTAAVNLAQLTGDSIDKTTSDIIKLADAPAKHLAELNERYHFLTVATYDQVRALQEQGKYQDAVAVGLAELKRVTDERVKEMEARAGTLESAWKKVGDTVAGVWQSIKDVGRTDDEHLLAQARARLNRAEGQMQVRGFTGEIGQQSAAKAREEIRVIEERIAARKREVEAAAATQRQEDAGIKARLEQEKTTEEARKKAERERELAAKQRVADADRLRKAADTEIAGMQRQIALGEKATQVAKVRYEIEHGAYAALDGARQQALLKEAARVDAYTAAQKNSEDYKSLLEDLQTKEEKLTNQMLQRLTVLDAARARGAVNDADYGKAAGRTIAAGYEPAPKVGQIKDGEEAAALAEQERWFSRQMAQLERDRAARVDLNTRWDDEEKELKRQHQAALDDINRQSSTNYDAMWSQSFDRFAAGVGQATANALFQSQSLGEGLRNVVLAMGQQVIATLVEIGVKRMALTLLDKVATTSAAVGYVASITSQSAAQTAMAGLNAFASTAAIPVVGPALAPAAAAAATAAAGTMSAAAVAAASTGIVAGMAHDGIARVPAANEGTWLLKQDEMVLNPQQADNFGTLLNFIQAQQGAAQGGASGGSAGGARKLILTIYNQGGERQSAVVKSQQVVGDEERIEIALLGKQMMVKDLIERGEFAQTQEALYPMARRGR